MSRIDELIEKLCPDGVEYKALGEVVSYEQPTKYLVSSAKYDDAWDIPVLTAGQTFILGYTNERDGVYRASKDNPVVIFDDFTTAFKWVDFPFKAKSSAMKMLRLSDGATKVLLRYVYYAMCCIDYEATDHARHWISVYSRIRIPVPPMEVQEEIVRVLDSFAELEARRKQYAFYRDKVLVGCAPDCEKWASLGSVGQFFRGSSFQKVHLREEGTPCIHYGQIYTHYGLSASITKSYLSPDFAKGKKSARQGDLVIATTSENEDDVCKAVAWLGAEDVIVSNDAYVFRHCLEPRYISYVFQSGIFQDAKRPFIIGTKVLRVSGVNMAKIRIPVPSMGVQKEIADKLDAFDGLLSDVAQGLPAEIEARRKQYEYYCEKLLTFKEKAS